MNSEEHKVAESCAALEAQFWLFVSFKLRLSGRSAAQDQGQAQAFEL